MILEHLKNKNYWIGFISLLIVAYIPLFDSLGSLPIVLWDESRLAHNALEMYDSGNWLYLTYDGVADHFNAKPPMMIWLQVISLKIFGLTEFAIRFPSAMSGLFICILLYWFLGKKLATPLLGFIASAVLLTSIGYVKIHATRTGDFDTLLTFFTLSYSIFFYLYLEEEKKKYLYICFAAMIFAVLTKGVAGMILFPALFLYLLYKRKFISFLKTPQVYLGIGTFLIIILGYYFLRNQYDKNYIADMLDNEITGRFWRKDKMANYDKLYYFDLLVSKSFKWWFSFLPIGLCLGFIAEQRKWKNLIVFATVFGLIQFVFVSFSESKTHWYDMPSYPFFAMIVAVAIYIIYRFIQKEAKALGINRSILAPLCLLLLFIMPSKAIYKSNNTQDFSSLKEENINMGYYMKGIIKDKSIRTDNIAIVNRKYCADVSWYVKVLQHEGREVPMVHIDHIMLNHKNIIVFEDDVKQQIENTFTFEKQDNFRNVTLYRLHGKK